MGSRLLLEAGAAEQGATVGAVEAVHKIGGPAPSVTPVGSTRLVVSFVCTAVMHQCSALFGCVKRKFALDRTIAVDIKSGREMNEDAFSACTCMCMYGCMHYHTSQKTIISKLCWPWAFVEGRTRGLQIYSGKCLAEIKLGGLESLVFLSAQVRGRIKSSTRSPRRSMRLYREDKSDRC